MYVCSYRHGNSRENQVEYSGDNPAYEYVATPSESNPETAAESVPYQVTVIGAPENVRTESPAEYIMPSNTELITCNQCLEHRNMGICTHRRNPYQSLIITESSGPSGYQHLKQDVLTQSLKESRHDSKPEPVQEDITDM